MRLKMGYVKTKREIFFRRTNNEGCIIILMKGKEIYYHLKKSAKDFKVDCGANILFSFDVLLSDSCREEFFFINPDKNKIISMYKEYSDLWYNLNIGNIKKRTYTLVEKCLKLLYKNGFTDSNLICFIKEDDGYYHLVVDGEDYGYLDDSSSDADFKNMLAYIFKDMRSSVDVVVLPSKGENLIFSSSVGVFKKKDDFKEACISKGISLSVLGVREKEIENLVAVDRV